MERDTLRIARQFVAGSQPWLDGAIQAVDIEQRFIDQALRSADHAGGIRIKVLGISILFIRQHGERIWMQGPRMRSCAITSATGGQQNDEKREERHPVCLCSSLELSG